MKNVLIVSYVFPPFGGGYVVRVYNFVKYLPQFGWQPIVLTVNEGLYERWGAILDPLLKLPNSIKVIRTGSLGLPAKNLKKIRANTKQSSTSCGWLGESLKALKRKISEALAIPDTQILWIPYALKEGTKLLSIEDIDAIFITVPPHSIWILGYLLKRIGKKPLIIDVRDDWVGNPNFKPKYLHRYLIERVIENKIVRSCDAIVCTTEESFALFRRKYPMFSSNKYFMIPNGFNPEDLPAISKRDKDTNMKLQLIYSGRLPKKRSPVCLFKALKELCDEFQNDVFLELHIYGFMDEEYQKKIYELKIDKLVKYHGIVSHEECVKQITKSDVGLVIIPSIEGSETAIPGKIYEYLSCDKFTLTLADRGSAVANLVMRESLGIVADPQNVEDIKRAVKRILIMFEDGVLSQIYSVDMKQRYNRINHSKQLSDLLLQVV